MFFPRKPKNRCFDREQVLDVKVRSDELRHRRLRAGLLALAFAFSVAVIVFVGSRGLEWALSELVFTNEAFAVQVIDVQTDGVIAADQLRRWTGIKPGDNLLALDLRRIKRDLELSPLVQSAAVERVLPHTLRVRVIEREPIARVQMLQPRVRGSGLEAVTYYLDETGFVMFPLGRERRGGPPFLPADELPVLTGIALGEVPPGRVVEAPRIHAALRFVQAFEQSPMAGWVEVQRLDVSAPETLAVTTGQGSEVTFAAHRVEDQLRRWQVIHEHARKQGKLIATLDLSLTNNIPARWSEAGDTSAVGPKKIKLSRYKKKHV